jgi:2C-methyl-D-erythritol 2,4-cyclodiphosphate synthase
MSVRWLTDVSQTKIEVTMKFNTKPTHTCGRRIRAAGVSLETHKLLLGHKNGDITSHCSADEIAELLEASNRICLTKSGNGFSEKKNRLAGYVKRLILLLNMVRHYGRSWALGTACFIAHKKFQHIVYVLSARSFSKV